MSTVVYMHITSSSIAIRSRLIHAPLSLALSLRPSASPSAFAPQPRPLPSPSAFAPQPRPQPSPLSLPLSTSHRFRFACACIQLLLAHPRLEHLPHLEKHAAKDPNEPS